MIQLRWTHLMLVWLAAQNGGDLKYNEVFNKDDLDGTLVNRWMDEQNVPAVYGAPIRHPQTQQNLFASLEKLGLVTRPGFTLTEMGAAFASGLSDDWREWPTLLPFDDDGQPVWEQAKRIPYSK